MPAPSLNQRLGHAHRSEQSANGAVNRRAIWEGAVKIPTSLCWVVFGTLIFLVSVNVDASSPILWQPLESIREVATRFVEDRTQQSERQATVTASELDSRLRLHRCASDLEPYLPPGAQLGSHTTVGVRCAGPKRWKLFVPVTIRQTADILVARKSLVAGTVLSSNDVRVARREVTSLHGGYLLASEPIDGLVLTRRLDEGLPLRASVLTTPHIIRRGQALSIVSAASNGAVAIRMAGTALSDGRLGERIRVKNRSSGRTIEAIVRSAERVEVAF